MSFDIIPVASGYQEIHPYSAINIDSVKFNTSLIMMKEWHIYMRKHAHVSASFCISRLHIALPNMDTLSLLKVLELQDVLDF